MPFQKFLFVLSSFMAISFNFYYPSGIFKRQGYGQKQKYAVLDFSKTAYLSIRSWADSNRRPFA